MNRRFQQIEKNKNNRRPNNRSLKCFNCGGIGHLYIYK